MSLHHTTDPVCPLCEEKKQLAHPILQKWWDAIKLQFKDAHLSWTFRDEADQDIAFNNGKSKLRFPNSAHNKTPARAMDIFQINATGVACFMRPYYQDINDFLQENQAPIYWGGHWIGLGDTDHFQLNQNIV